MYIYKQQLCHKVTNAPRDKTFQELRPKVHFFDRPIDPQSTSNNQLKPVMTAGLVNMLIDRIANLGLEVRVMVLVHDTPCSKGE